MGDIFKLLDLLLKYGYITIPIILWMLWGWYHWRIFHTQHSDRYDDACNRRLSWLKQDRWSSLYLNWLSTLLDKVSSVIGDAEQEKHNRVSRFFGKYFGFDHNPWTEPSFNLLFRIALVYPILSFIVFWLMGGTGRVGDVELLPNDVKLSEAQRWGFGIAMFAELFGVYLLMSWLKSLSGWKAVIALSPAMVLMVLIILVENQGEIHSAIRDTVPFLILEIILPIVIAGYAISSLFFRDWQRALIQVRTIMCDVSVAFTLGWTIFLSEVSLLMCVFVFTGDFTFDRTLTIEFISMFATVITLASLIAGTGPVTLVCAVAGLIAGDFAFYVFGVVFVSAASASAGIVFFFILFRHIQTKNWEIWYWLLLAGLVLVLLMGFLSIQMMPNRSAIFCLFLLVFPLLNLPLDWLSLGVTRGLLQSICSGTHQGLRGFYWALADVVIAFILLVLMATILFIAVQFANDLRLSEGNGMLLDLGALLSGMEQNPANPDFYWIYFMLFSTLLPTLVHFALAGASVVLWFPAQIRHVLVKNWHNDADKKLEIWFYVSIMPVLGFVIAPSLLLYSLWLLLNNFDVGIGVIHVFQMFV